MAKFRYVNTGKWDDQWHRSIGIVGRGLFDYLMTNPLTNISGIYATSLARMAFDTGIDESELKKLLAKFEEEGKVFWLIGGSNDFIIMKNWLRHQSLNKNQWKSVGEFVNALPVEVRTLILPVQSDYYIPFERLSKGFLSVSKDSATYTLNLNLELVTQTPNSNAKGRGAKGADDGGGMKQISLGDDATWR